MTARAKTPSVAPPLRGKHTVPLLLPAAVLILVLFACTLVLLRISFGRKNQEWTAWTLESYAALADPIYLLVLVQTVWLALLSAVIAVIVAFPIALSMARTRSRFIRSVLLAAVMLPMLVSLLVQSFGWLVALGPTGVVNTLWRLAFGPTSQPPALLFSWNGVLLGLVQTALPLAVLPLASSLRTVPADLEEAAAMLGAGRWAVYREIILPLVRPGLVAGGILVFGFNVGAFVVPLLLGGLKVTTAAVVIRDQMGPLLDWPLGAAFAVILIIVACLAQLAGLGRNPGGAR